MNKKIITNRNFPHDDDILFELRCMNNKGIGNFRGAFIQQSAIFDENSLPQIKEEISEWVEDLIKKLIKEMSWINKMK